MQIAPNGAMRIAWTLAVLSLCQCDVLRLGGTGGSSSTGGGTGSTGAEFGSSGEPGSSASWSGGETGPSTGDGQTGPLEMSTASGVTASSDTGDGGTESTSGEETEGLPQLDCPGAKWMFTFPEWNSPAALFVDSRGHLLMGGYEAGMTVMHDIDADGVLVGSTVVGSTADGQYNFGGLDASDAWYVAYFSDWQSPTGGVRKYAVGGSLLWDRAVGVLPEASAPALAVGADGTTLLSIGWEDGTYHTRLVRHDTTGSKTLDTTIDGEWLAPLAVDAVGGAAATSIGEHGKALRLGPTGAVQWSRDLDEPVTRMWAGVVAGGDFLFGGAANATPTLAARYTAGGASVWNSVVLPTLDSGDATDFYFTSGGASAFSHRLFGPFTAVATRVAPNGEPAGSHVCENAAGSPMQVALAGDDTLYLAGAGMVGTTSMRFLAAFD
ncbi:hypothetical protein [Nannocystis punicea]|uniref:Uncharacterized protein n=1 Tax=Nannocystis punicea TaxID=2995304 RepID=A0ABY7HAX8_9BACT|nr:hypothetical protein [Nannocystis poenicansa]WAS96434.1 hypothetical protein O0S08_09770 [Nannocystis poenicansa]